MQTISLDAKMTKTTISFLPRELLDKIFTLIVLSPEPIHISHPPSSSTTLRTFLHLSRTNKRLRASARYIFYACNIFVTGNAPGDKAALQHFSIRVPASLLGTVRKVTFEVCLAKTKESGKESERVESFGDATRLVEMAALAVKVFPRAMELRVERRVVEGIGWMVWERERPEEDGTVRAVFEAVMKLGGVGRGEREKVVIFRDDWVRGGDGVWEQVFERLCLKEGKRVAGGRWKTGY